MDPVRVGLIGRGNISAAYRRASAAFFREELAFVAVADLNESRASARAREFGLRATTVDALLADPAVEVVLNLTVPQAHVPAAMNALRIGPHRCDGALGLHRTEPCQGPEPGSPPISVPVMGTRLYPV